MYKYFYILTSFYINKYQKEEEKEESDFLAIFIDEEV
jgi:hypothetical protein